MRNELQHGKRARCWLGAAGNLQHVLIACADAPMHKIKTKPRLDGDGISHSQAILDDGMSNVKNAPMMTKEIKEKVLAPMVPDTSIVDPSFLQEFKEGKQSGRVGTKA